MKNILLIFALLATLGAQGQTAGGRQSAGNSYQDMKLGLFVHYMNPAKEYRWGSTQWADGSQVQSLGELADNFDADDLAKTAASMGVQYVIFTTWHANMNVLYPSEVMKKWLPGHCTERDVIRDLISALKAREIKLILYVHPSDGHDFTKEDQERSGWTDGVPYKRWNDFINEVFEEVAARYGKDLSGLYIDGGLPPQVDAARLRKTITARMPDAWLIQNSGLNPALVDYAARERMETPYHATTWMMCHTITYEWWALSGTVTFCPELAYQYTVLQAAVQGATGGGVAWSFGPHPGGRWELGVRSFCVRLGEMVKKAGPSLFGTRPGKAFITKDGTPLIGLTYAATESADGKKTYVHLFKPPKGNTFSLPLTADGRRFTSARLIGKRDRVRLNQNETGIIITVKSPAVWDDVDTIIELR
ncbi:MAG: alpha-L-fucosidase [Bacteroidia bacterium]|nr:alpha-L-fucosidase [Bacteroidia bacterium]